MFVIEDVFCLDVETANRNKDSICQIGVARLAGKAVSPVLDKLVNPRQRFLKEHVGIHGITSGDVADSPTFRDVYEDVLQAVQGKAVLSWKNFDGLAISLACAKNDLPPPDCVWIDARELFYAFNPGIPGNASLGAICEMYGIPHTPHHALSDAMAAMQLVEHTLYQTGLLPCVARFGYRVKVEGDYFHKEVSEKVISLTPRSQRFDYDSAAEKSVAIDGDPGGPHFGQVVVITGDLSVGRKEFAECIAAQGFSVKKSITKKTTVVIKGHGPGKGKLGKAEEYMAAGQPILIVSEEEFREVFGVTP